MSPALAKALADVLAAQCVWCCNTAGDSPAHPDPEDLCRFHQAEYEGLSVDELDRRDDEQQSEVDDLG